MKDIILTEKINPNTKNIDIVSTEKIVEMINNEDLKIAHSIKNELLDISKAVDIISENFIKGGNLLYFGAGTSGRLGILDASECPPTFNAGYEMVRGYIAGGDTAIKKAVEGAEDDKEQGKLDLINAEPKKFDTVVAISASGNAPYLLGVIEQAKEIGIKTIAVVCNKKAKLKKVADVTIAPEVGPEAITGSTRMKAGTAQKMVLNMLSTASMVKIGKTYENLMIDVQPTNKKLVDRSIRIVSQIAGVDYNTAKEKLESNNFDIKNTIVMINKNCASSEAKGLLDNNNGVLRRVINNEKA